MAFLVGTLEPDNAAMALSQVYGHSEFVSDSDGSSDTYDTVLGAIGRHADTDKLGLETVGIKTNPKNKKIPTKFEQTETPNIYAVGDVMEVRCWVR